MRIVVFGASGGVGKHLCRLAAGEGHDVIAVVRSATSFEPPPGVAVVTGDVLADGVIEDAIAGRELVLSALGLKRRNPANPWSALVSPADFVSRTARRIVAGMKLHGVRRAVAVSAAGVGDSAVGMNLAMRLAIASTNVGVAYRDLAVMEQVYAASGLEICCPRPTVLTDGPRTDRVRVVERFGMTASISRVDVAAWMLAQGVSGQPFPSATPQLSVT